MERDDRADPVFARLKALAATDPRQAREVLGRVLDDASADIEPLLRGAASPGEGRLRQLIANTLRVRGEQARWLAHLQAWREIEPDEFTRRALDAALEGVRRPAKPAERRPSLVDRHRLEAHRYVSDRLKHQLRNALMEPMGRLIRLRGQVDSLEEGGVRG